MSSTKDSPNAVTVIFKVPVKDLPEPLRFYSVEELLDWVAGEERFWSWLEGASRKKMGAPLLNLWGDMSSRWNQIRSTLHTYRENPNTKKALLDQVQNMLTELYASGYGLPSFTSKAQFVNKLKDVDPVEAAFLLQSFLNPQQVPITSQPLAIRAMIKAHLFEAGLVEGAAEAERNALSIAQQEWNQFLENTKSEAQSRDAALAALNSQIDQTLTSAHKDFEVTLNDAKTKLAEIEKTYDTKLSLLAPVDYWRRKAEDHASSSRGYGTAWLVTLIFLVAIVVLEIIFVLEPSRLPEVNEGYLKAEAWRYLVVGGTAALLIWPLRVFARMYLSHLHLTQDCSERVTMVNTYLSLLRSGDGLQEADRRLI